MRLLQLCVCVGVLVLGGCSSWDLWSRSEDSDKTPVGGSQVKLVGDLAGPYGMFPVKVEAIGLVVGLPGTGSEPAPSPNRAILLEEMKRRKVDKPSQLLASKNTALVIVRGFLRPGIQKGDLFDVEVRIPSRSETTSLRGGWLMETRLKQMTVRDGQIFDGHTLGIAEGPIMVDPPTGGKQDKVLASRGRVLSGGRSLRTRSLGLALKTGHQNVSNSSKIAKAINNRFFTMRGGGIQEGVAKAKTDKYVDLQVHPRYKDNVGRYISVVRSIAMRETTLAQQNRIKLLKQQLCDPITSAHAALQLEGVGRQGIGALKEGLASNDPEVRFRSAESLAYLDEDSAAEVLGEIALNQPAFRVFALTALGTMDGYSANEQLAKLLDVPSAETRYGAFRAMWSKNPLDAKIRGENLGEQFSFHVLDSQGPPMVHVTRSRRPEIVLFGAEQKLQAPFSLEAGPQIMVNNLGDDQISISKFTVGEPDQKRIVSTKINDVVRAIVDLGGTYPDVVQMLQHAKATKSLASRFEVDALPQAGRRYDRVAGREAEEGLGGSIQPDGTASREIEEISDLASPEDLEQDVENIGDFERGEGNVSSNGADTDSQRHPIRSFFAKMTGSE